MDTSIEKLSAQRKLYQSLITAAFALKTFPKNLCLQSVLYLGALDWFISVSISFYYSGKTFFLFIFFLYLNLQYTISNCGNMHSKKNNA